MYALVLIFLYFKISEILIVYTLYFMNSTRNTTKNTV